MGPAPLNAIKQGQINMAYDTKFVFAEVNAEVVYYRKDKNGEYKPFKVKIDTVGRFLI